jgi:uncharacterized ferritin-like protein (DUF455 family)
MLKEEANKEATQRTSHLLNTALDAAGITPSQLSIRLVGKTTLYKKITRITKGDILPRLDTLTEMLEACGFELSISMRRKVEDDGDE